MSESTTTVHLLRHGEVENPGAILYGRLPGFHLSALGSEMAERTAQGSPFALLLLSVLPLVGIGALIPQWNRAATVDVAD